MQGQTFTLDSYQKASLLSLTCPGPRTCCASLVEQGVPRPLSLMPAAETVT